MGKHSRVHKPVAKRTMAIAVAAGVALSTAPVVDIIVPGGAVARAAETSAIPADAIKVLGIFDKDGNQVTGPIAGDTTIADGYEVRLNVDISKVEEGSAIGVFFGASDWSQYSGGGIKVGSADTKFGVTGGPADVLRVSQAKGDRVDNGKVASGVTITGLENASNITSGTVPVTIPVYFGGYYGDGDGLVQQSADQSQDFTDQVVRYWTKSALDQSRTAPASVPGDVKVSYRQYLPGFNTHDKTFQTWTDVAVDGVDANLSMHGTMPVNPPNGTASILFHPKNDGLDGDTPWELRGGPDDWGQSVSAVLIHGSDKTLTDEQKQAIDLKVTEEDGGFRVTISNIPEDARATFSIKNIGRVDAAKSAQYRLAPTDYNPKIGGGFGRANSAATVSGINGSVEASREPTLKVLIDGGEWTQDKPYEVTPGEEYEFTLKLGLGGNARISHPVVTGPNGEQLGDFPDISFVPGDEQEVTVKYTPTENDSELKFAVTYASGETAEASTFVEPVAGCGCTVNYKGEDKPVQEVVDDLSKRLDAAEGKVDTLEKQNTARENEIKELREQLGNANDAIEELKKADQDLQDKLDQANGKITDLENNLAAIAKRLGVLEDRLNTGLGKCVGTVGGSLLALIPAALLASQVIGGTHIEAIDQTIAEMQRQMGMFNPDLAKAVDDNRGAIAASFAGLGLLALLLTPGTCGDASLGHAIVEPLSSQRDA